MEGTATIIIIVGVLLFSAIFFVIPNFIKSKKIAEEIGEMPTTVKELFEQIGNILSKCDTAMVKWS